MALLQECLGTLVESGQNFPEHLDLGSPGKRWQTSWITLWAVNVLWFVIHEIAGDRLSVWLAWTHRLSVATLTSERDVVQKVNLCGSTWMETHLEMGCKTCSVYTEKVPCQAFSSCSCYRVWDERLHRALQERSRSQELWLCWKQSISLRTWIHTPISPPPSLPCFKNLGDLKWKPFNL